MEKNNEIEQFRKRSVLAICAAGTDRSRYISEELNDRGYFATAAGVIKNQNYVTKEDLVDVGIIVFSSCHEKKIFDKDSHLKEYISRNGIETRVLNISENAKNVAHNTNKVDELRQKIKTQLDCVGLKDLNK